MPLTCYCPDYDDADEPGAIWYDGGISDYIEFPHRRRKRCRSCRSLISPGDTCATANRWRFPVSDVEANIHGGEDAEIPLAPDYLCEECADIFNSLDELGYCVMPYENMHDILEEYHELKQG